MSDIMTQTSFELIPGKKVKFIDKLKGKHLTKLKELGFDFENAELMNAKRISLIQDGKLQKELYDLMFDEDISEEDLGEIYPFELREVLDSFLFQRCKIRFEAPKQ